MKPQHFAFMVLINLVWALALVAVTIGMEDIPPLLFTTLRFALLAAVLVPLLKWHPGQMRDILIVSLGAGGVQFGLFYTGIYIADDLSSVAIASQLGVPFTTLLGMLVLGEAVGWRRWGGMLLAFGGVMVISFDPRVLGYIDGMIFGVMAALTGAVSVIAMRRLKNIGAFELQAWVAMLSWPLLLPVTLFVETDIIGTLAAASLTAWSALIFAALVSNLVAHAGLYMIIRRYEVSKVSPLTLMTPVFTIILGVTFLGDVLTERMLLGGLLTLIGVLIISLRKPEPTVDLAEAQAEAVDAPPQAEPSKTPVAGVRP